METSTHSSLPECTPRSASMEYGDLMMLPMKNLSNIHNNDDDEITKLALEIHLFIFKM